MRVSILSFVFLIVSLYVLLNVSLCVFVFMCQSVCLCRCVSNCVFVSVCVSVFLCVSLFVSFCVCHREFHCIRACVSLEWLCLYVIVCVKTNIKKSLNTHNYTLQLKLQTSFYLRTFACAM